MRESPLEVTNLSPTVNQVLTLTVARCVVCFCRIHGNRNNNQNLIYVCSGGGVIPR